MVSSGLLPSARARGTLLRGVQSVSRRHVLGRCEQIGFAAGLTELGCLPIAQGELLLDPPAGVIAAGNPAGVSPSPRAAQITVVAREHLVFEALGRPE